MTKSTKEQHGVVDSPSLPKLSGTIKRGLEYQTGDVQCDEIFGQKHGLKSRGHHLRK